METAGVGLAEAACGTAQACSTLVLLLLGVAGYLVFGKDVQVSPTLGFKTCVACPWTAVLPAQLHGASVVPACMQVGWWRARF